LCPRDDLDWLSGLTIDALDARTGDHNGIHPGTVAVFVILSVDRDYREGSERAYRESGCDGAI